MQDTYSIAIQYPHYFVATRLITLSPYTRSHSITVATALSKDADNQLSIISADENCATVINAIKADYNALQKEAEQQAKQATTDGKREVLTIISGWEDFDTDGIHQPPAKAWYYRPRRREGLCR
jgi:hypothetical protein